MVRLIPTLLALHVDQKVRVVLAGLWDLEVPSFPPSLAPLFLPEVLVLLVLQVAHWGLGDQESLCLQEDRQARQAQACLVDRLLPLSPSAPLAQEFLEHLGVLVCHNYLEAQSCP